MESIVLTISSEQIQLWDSERKTLSISEHLYVYSIDGNLYGQKLVDGATRQEFIRRLFQIAQNSSKIDYKRKEHLNDIKLLGESIFDLMLPDKLSEYLSKLENETILIKTSDHDIPWEIMHDGNSFLCHKLSFGREIIKNKKHNLINRKGINICLIGNPTDDLPATSDEIEILRKKLSAKLSLLKKAYDVKTTLKVLTKDDANKVNVLFKTLISKSDNWDIIHYAGHAKFNSIRPEGSSLLLADGELKAYEVEKLNSSPLVFVNACYSGLAINTEPLTGFGLLKGIASSFVKSGALGYVGSIWPIEDKTAKLICEKFYESILDGAGIGDALLEAKKEAKNQNLDPGSIGYVLYGDPSSKLPIFEPTLTSGPYVNEQGFVRIIQLEKEYFALEILLANDLPWILWRPEDFITWVSRIPATENKRNSIQLILLDYHRYFRNLIISGQKTFIGIINLKVVKHYLSDKPEEIKNEILNDIIAFTNYSNFTLLMYEGDEEEIEEIEIVSKFVDVYHHLDDSVYVFNKQVRFEERPPSYSVHLNFNTSLIKEYTDRFYKYYEKCVIQYSIKSGSAWAEHYKDVSNFELNKITVHILEDFIKS